MEEMLNKYLEKDILYNELSEKEKESYRIKIKDSLDFQRYQLKESLKEFIYKLFKNH